MSNFTIGNWVFWKNKKYPYWYVGKEGSERYIATVDKEANARLIAAAPEMYELLYEALQELKGYDPIGNGISTIYPDIEKLIARIDGDIQEG